MKVRKTRFLQEGGQMPADQGAPQGAPQGGNPEEQLMAIAQDIVGQLGPEASAMVAEMILQLVKGGGGAEAAPAEEAPVMARRGGRLMKRF